MKTVNKLVAKNIIHQLIEQDKKELKISELGLNIYEFNEPLKNKLIEYVIMLLSGHIFFTESHYNLCNLIYSFIEERGNISIEHERYAFSPIKIKGVNNLIIWLEKELKCINETI